LVSHLRPPNSTERSEKTKVDPIETVFTALGEIYYENYSFY